MEPHMPTDSAEYALLSLEEADNLGWVDVLPIDVQRMLASDPRVQVRLSFVLGSRERDEDVVRELEMTEEDSDVLSSLRDQIYASPTVKRQLGLDMVTSRVWLDVVCTELHVSESTKSALWNERSTADASNITFGDALDSLMRAESN